MLELDLRRHFGRVNVECTQGFFDLLQRVGEEMGLLHLDDDELDDAVPLPAIRASCICDSTRTNATQRNVAHSCHCPAGLLAEHFIVGFTKMLPQMGFNIHAMLPSCTIPMTNR